MFKTGNSLMDYLLMVIIFLPLMPALFIFGRKLYLQEPLNFLLIVCLLSFFKGLLELTYPMTRENQYFINKLFSLILLLLLVLCFRANLTYRYILDILLSALLSLAITYWSLMGWENPSPAIDTLLNAFLGIVILVSLPVVIRTGALQVFRSPLFWIGSGTLFYILLYLLLTGIGSCCRPVSSPPDPEKRLFLLLAEFVKYSFYLIAAVTTKPSFSSPS